MADGALRDFDAIVIGNGAGGGTAAAELAGAGLRVLLVDRGPREDRPIYRNARRTAPFDVAPSPYERPLLRPGPSDFEPGRHCGDRLPRHLWEWPLAHDSMRPYFDRAEDLLGVAGDATAPTPHLDRRRRSYPHPVAPHAPAAERLVAAWRARGLAPFPLPSGSDEAAPVRRARSLTVRDGCEAERFEVVGGKVDGVWLRDRATGHRDLLRARVYLLGAGAIGTPVLLLRSGLEGRSNQVGRNHMGRLGVAAVGLFAMPIGAVQRCSHPIGLSDLYLGTQEFPHPLGVARVAPPPHGTRAISTFRLPPSVARGLDERALLLLGSIADLPQPSNRVALGSGGTIRLERRFHTYDLLRGRRMVRELKRLLREAGALARFGRIASDADAGAEHAVGTCRFGRDPRTSVIDVQCRVHGQDDVYVVDGSFLPTSLGVDPTLTVVANAVRVADAIAKDHARGAAHAGRYLRT